MRGRLIVLEGIDGCGKTTQIRHLTNWLPVSGVMPDHAQLHLTREPGGTALGSELRKLLLNPPGEQSPEPISELLLYAADRAQHVSQVIRPALEKGDWVISDRFSGSTLAYQGYGRQLNIEVINQLESIATEGLVPDITLWLDLPIEESFSRRQAKIDDRIEAEGIDFLARVASGFAALSKANRWIQIPANQAPDLVSKRIEAEITQLLALLTKKNQ